MPFTHGMSWWVKSFDSHVGGELDFLQLCQLLPDQFLQLLVLFLPVSELPVPLDGLHLQLLQLYLLVALLYYLLQLVLPPLPPVSLVLLLLARFGLL